MSEAIVPFDPMLTPLKSLIEANFIDNRDVGRDVNARGVFAQTPVSTPKFINFHPNRKQEYEDTMARMLLQVPEGTLEALANELEDGDTQNIVKILANDGKSGGFGYLDFFLATATHTFAEKVQISESLADNYVAFFYGSSPPIFQYSGMLMNTYEDDWNMRMFRIFRDLGRGTQLARRGSLFHLRYDSMIVSGSMLNFSSTLTAGMETAVSFNFSFLVKKLEIILGAYGEPTNLGKMLSPGVTKQGLTAGLSTRFGELAPLATFSGREKTVISAPSGGAKPAGLPTYDPSKDYNVEVG